MSKTRARPRGAPGIEMNIRKFYLAIFTATWLAASCSPAYAVSKEVIQLQTQVQDLSDRMSQMRQSFDERMGVIQNLVNHSTDVVNQMSDAAKQQNSDTQTKIDQLSGQLQTLNDSLDELKARLTKLSKQLEDIQNQQGNLPAAAAAPAPAAAATAAQAPPADTLYNNALRDYNAARYELALGQFQDFLKYYPTDNLAGNVQFYIADIEYKAGNFKAAVTDYDKVIEQFPGGNKAAAAQLKKGYSLLELGRKEDGIRELTSLIQRYPRSIEATQARERLQKLGVSSKRVREAR